MEQLNNEQLAYIYTHSQRIRKFCSKVEEYIYSKANQGIKFPGYKLVKGRQSRKWLADKDYLAEELRARGIKNPYKEPELKSLTNIEAERPVVNGKKVKKEGFLEGLVYTSEGKPKLVSEEVEGKEVLAKSEAAALLENLPDN